MADRPSSEKASSDSKVSSSENKDSSSGENQSASDERYVYLALKNTFKDQDALRRKPKKIRELISKQVTKDKPNPYVRDLITQLGYEKVCDVTRVLLEARVFESTETAQERFPDVFAVAPPPKAKESASNVEAAAIPKSTVRGGDSGEPAQSSDQDSPQPGTLELPSLYPIYLPSGVQACLLAKVQDILKEACFEYGERNLKRKMEHEGWDRTQDIDLNSWVRMLSADAFRYWDPFTRTLKPLREVLDSLSYLRQKAVDGTPLGAAVVEQLIADAETLTRHFKNDGCAMVLAGLRKETQLCIGELRQEKYRLEAKAQSEMVQIAAVRAELDRREQRVAKEMVEEDEKSGGRIGEKLCDVVRAVSIPTAQSAAPAEVASESGGTGKAETEGGAAFKAGLSKMTLSEMQSFAASGWENDVDESYTI